MKCAVHTEVDATGFCRNCGKALCDACRRDVRGILYCEDCLARLVTQPPPAPGAGNPALAAVLGFIPGLGAVYNGEYMKALIHVLVFGSLIALANTAGAHGGEALFVILTAAFYFYMPIEAYRTAKVRQSGQPVTDPLAGFTANKPVGAILLILLGSVLLVENLFPRLHLWERIGDFWPVILIAIGVWLLLRRQAQSTPGGGAP